MFIDRLIKYDGYGANQRQSYGGTSPPYAKIRIGMGGIISWGDKHYVPIHEDRAIADYN